MPNSYKQLGSGAFRELLKIAEEKERGTKRNSPWVSATLSITFNFVILLDLNVFK